MILRLLRWQKMYERSQMVRENQMFPGVGEQPSMKVHFMKIIVKNIIKLVLPESMWENLWGWIKV